MKLKNVSFIEQHFEKLLVAIGAAVLLFVSWKYLIGEPNDVDLGGQKRNPAEIDPFIASKAKSLEEQAKSNEPRAWYGQKMASYAADFQKRTLAPVLGVSKFDVPIHRIAEFQGGPVIPVDQKPFIEPKYPDPKMYAWAARIASISPEEVELDTDQWKQIIHDSSAFKSKAFDMAYVSLVAKWDTAAVLEELTRKDENEAQRQVPDIGIKTFAVMDVVVQRQSPRSDGTWAKPQDPDFNKFTQTLEVTPPPIFKDNTGGYFFFPRKIPDQVDEKDFTDQEAVATAAVVQGPNQWLLIQPPFPQMVTDEKWEEPISPEALNEQQENLNRKEQIETDFKEWQKQIDMFNARKQKMLNQRAMVAPAPPAAGGGRPGRAPRALARPAAMAPPTTGPNRQAARIDEQIKRIMNDPKVAQEQEEYQKLTNGQTISLHGEGLGVAGSYGGMFGPGGFGPQGPGAGGLPGPGGPGNFPRPQIGAPGPAPQPGIGPLGPGGPFPGNPAMARGMQLMNSAGIQSGILTNPELTIYAHDLTPEPGKTYRYRLQLRVVNPLFNIETMPQEQKDRHARQFLIHTGWSDWTEPREIPRLKHYFVEAVSPSPAPGKAKVEVWRYYKGLWRTKAFDTLRPGSPVGMVDKVEVYDPFRQRQVREDVDFFTGAYILDIVTVRPVKSGKTESKARFMDGDAITERSPAADKGDELRLRLQQEKQLLDRIAGVTGPVAQGS